MNSIFAPEVKPTVKPKVGDLLYGSYGYDASIPHVYKVLGVTGASVKIQEVVVNNVYSNGGMDWEGTVTDKTEGEILTKRFRLMEKTYRVKIHSCLNVYGPWEGKKVTGYNYH